MNNGTLFISPLQNSFSKYLLNFKLIRKDSIKGIDNPIGITSTIGSFKDGKSKSKITPKIKLVITKKGNLPLICKFSVCVVDVR